MKTPENSTCCQNCGNFHGFNHQCGQACLIFAWACEGPDREDCLSCRKCPHFKGKREWRVDKDGKKREYWNGRPVYTVEETANMDCPFPPEPNDEE